MGQPPGGDHTAFRIARDERVEGIFSKHYEKGLQPLIEQYYEFGLLTGRASAGAPAYVTFALIANEIRDANDHMSRAFRRKTLDDIDRQIEMVGWH